MTHAIGDLLPGGDPKVGMAKIDRFIAIDPLSLAIIRRILLRSGDAALSRSYIPSSQARGTA